MLHFSNNLVVRDGSRGDRLLASSVVSRRPEEAEGCLERRQRKVVFKAKQRLLVAQGAYLAAAVLGAVGQLCFKTAATCDLSSLIAAASCPYLWIAGASYFGVMGLFVLGLRLGKEVSALYPIYGSTFVFADLLSAWRLHERPSAAAMAGSVLISVGIVLLSKGKAL